MADMNANDPLAKISGLVPRYVRQRHAEAERLKAAAAAGPAEPVADIAELVDDWRAVDAATPDLRRRVVAATRRSRRPSLVVAGPAVAGLGIVLWQLVTNIANSTPLVLHTTM
jgi:hypothetical protein